MPSSRTTPDSPELTRDILAACRSLGFALAGITDAASSRYAPQFREWIAQGKHGEMAWLAESTETRLDPTKLLSGAQSIIIVADLYAPKHNGTEASSDLEAAGRIARYAQGLDYHSVIKRRLHTLADALRAKFPEHEFRSFADTAPILEREHAVRAGLGFIGKHTLLINPALGSYLLLGGMLTTLHLTPSNELAERVEREGTTDPQPPHSYAHPLPEGGGRGEGFPADVREASSSWSEPTHCGSCTRCIDACPTHAITPYSVDATRCISYLTIEHQTEIDPKFHAATGDWLFGCDVCQEVCPFNQERSPRIRAGSRPPDAAAMHPAYSPRRSTIPPNNILNWTESDHTLEISGSAMKRVTLPMLQRNARVVLSNSARPCDTSTESESA